MERILMSKMRKKMMKMMKIRVNLPNLMLDLIQESLIISPMLLRIRKRRKRRSKKRALTLMNSLKKNQSADNLRN